VIYLAEIGNFGFKEGIDFALYANFCRYRPAVLCFGMSPHRSVYQVGLG
jgi:hypothetical protein